MPRNSRNNKSSASIVTLVSSSPFHQPASSCSDNRYATAASRVARGSTCTCSSTRSGATVTSALPRHDEAAERDQLVGRVAVEIGLRQGGFAEGEPTARFLRGPCASPGGLDHCGRSSDVLVPIRTFG